MKIKVSPSYKKETTMADLVHVADEDASLLSIADDPANVIAQAREVAQAIMSLILKKPKQVVFNGEKYFENDDWVMAGKMYGIVPRILGEPEYVEFGDVKGFKAVCEAVLVATDQVVGRAYAMCLNDEENWGDRPKYEWKDVLDSEGKKIWEEKLIKGKMKKLPKSEKVQVGVVKVPLFQLMSMSQTRASSKVLSMVLKFVPVLAGFKPTPAEEIPNDGSEFSHELDADRPTRAKRKASPDESDANKPHDPDCITSNQASEMWRLARGKGKLSEQEVRERLAELKGKNGKPVTSALEMLKTDYIKFISSLPNVVESDYKQEEPGVNG